MEINRKIIQNKINRAFNCVPPMNKDQYAIVDFYRSNLLNVIIDLINPNIKQDLTYVRIMEDFVELLNHILTEEEKSYIPEIRFYIYVTSVCKTIYYYSDGKYLIQKQLPLTLKIIKP